MTSQKDQIQGLIAEIDSVLQKSTPRLPWVMSGDATQQRRVLEKVRNFLVALQKRSMTEASYGRTESSPNLLAYDISYQPPTQLSRTAGQPEASAQQMLQTVMQEMSYLRTQLMHPLQAELEALRQQREALVHEVRQLEGQRQGLGGAAAANQQRLMDEFLQILMTRLQETLPQQLAQTLNNSANLSLPYGAGQLDSALGTQSRTDEQLINFDSTLRIVFEALKRDIQAYQESLTQGLDRMHSLGQQGEMMFSALINHLAQQLGRGASSYLQVAQLPELQPGDKSEPTPSIAPPPPPSSSEQSGPSLRPTTAQPSSGSSAGSPTAAASSTSASAAKMAFPYPGIEIVPSESAATASNLEVASGMDAAIDSWIRSVGAANTEEEAESLEVAELDLSDLNLGDIDLSQVEVQDFDALLDLGADSPQPGPEVQAGDQRRPNVTEAGSTASTAAAETAEIDAALQWLEQLREQPQDSVPAAIGKNTTAQPSQTGQSSQATGDATAAARGLSEDARDELDEFYESLFGPDTETVALEGAALSVQGSDGMSRQEAGSESKRASERDAQEAEIADPTLGWDLLDEPAIAPPRMEENAELDRLTGREEVEPQQTPSPIQPPAPNRAIDSIERLFEESQPDLNLDLTKTADLPDLDRDEITTLTDLFATEEASGRSEPEETTPIDRRRPDWATSTDELPTGDLRLELIGKDQFQSATGGASREVDPTLGWDDDHYIPASPEEDLLPASESAEEATVGIWLDEMTLNRLNQDLSSLENAIEEPHPVFSSEPAEAVAMDWMLPDFPEEAAQTDATSTTAPMAWQEGTLDDFAAMLPVDTSDSSTELPAATAEVDTPFTLENITSLFGDTPELNPPAPAAASTPSTEQSVPLSLEGMDDLFGDLSSSVNPPATNPVADPLASQPNFSLEGIDDLFADVPAVSATPVSPSTDLSSSADQPLAFTLEGMDDLFADLPSTEASPSPLPGPSTAPLPDATTDFSLEMMSELFGDAPEIAEERPEPSRSSQQQAQPGGLGEKSLNQTQPADIEVQFPEKKTETP